MAKKMMTTLYYRNSSDARKDCELLGIDKRRVVNLRVKWARHTTWMPEGDVEVTAQIKVAQDVLDKLGRKVINQMHHIDDETTW